MTKVLVTLLLAALTFWGARAEQGRTDSSRLRRIGLTWVAVLCLFLAAMNVPGAWNTEFVRRAFGWAAAGAALVVIGYLGRAKGALEREQQPEGT